MAPEGEVQDDEAARRVVFVVGGGGGRWHAKRAGEVPPFKYNNSLELDGLIF